MSSVGKPIHCRAAVAWKVGDPINIETIEVQPPQSGEVRIKMLAASLCHSDVSKWQNKIFEEVPFPIVLGHEGVGIVESIGDEVTLVQPGDKVAVIGYGRCSKCDYCQSAEYKPCLLAKRQPYSELCDGTVFSRMSCKGGSLNQLFLVSTFSEYTVCPEFCAIKINADAPAEKVVPASCAICTGIGSTRHVAKVQSGNTVAIFGLGPIGLMCMMGAKQLGASKIIGIDIKPWKFDIAKQCGATDCIDPNNCGDTSLIETIRLICPEGVDIAIECVGDAEVAKQAYECTNPLWGRTCVLGGTPSGSLLSIDPLSLVFGRTITGAILGGTDQRKLVTSLVDEFLSGSLDWSCIITHNVKLDEINEAIQLNCNGESIKTVITF